ncbi:myoneurin-like [Musca vetustissima]|uniref:myoneurin-like n=1 Tax=Musca vetustissima TaxID=27455 RepID=UPI002AB67F14|nr:myoneurin-like [Musca vetustissima]
MSNKTNHKCRLCLVDSEPDKMQDLFAKVGSKSQNKTIEDIRTDDEFSQLPLLDKVEYCCGVKLLPKPQMPTKICTKCLNIVNMWSNFRQMCRNSQAFLASQIHLAIEEEVVVGSIKNLQKVRNELLKKTEAQQQHKREQQIASHTNSTTPAADPDLDIDYLVEEHYDLSKLNQIDFSEIFTPEDCAEAYDYLNAGNDDELEKIIEHCATKNVALQTLRRKAIISRTREQICTKKSPKYKKKPAADKLPKPSMFMCNICGNVYSKKPLFQYHMRMHSDVKPYQCEICNKSYRIMSDLRNHMYRHTGERPFKCKFCDRHFMDRSSRHRHERVHTNSRPYTCNVCSKSFTYSAILKNHMKLHTGEKDYICAVCNKSFTLAHQLKAHMLTLTHRQKEAAFEAQGYKVIFEAVEMTKTTKN